MRLGDIKILEAADGFARRMQIEDAFMPFLLKLGAAFVPDWFQRKVTELASVVVEEMPLVRTNGKEWYA